MPVGSAFFIFEESRNPLKSGQCFLLKPISYQEWAKEKFDVAIPSNRVNVSYEGKLRMDKYSLCPSCRNPLKSGQCFLRGKLIGDWAEVCPGCRNPLKSGQCFLLSGRAKLVVKDPIRSQSPQIGSMFLTAWVQSLVKLASELVAIPSNRVNVSY